MNFKLLIISILFFSPILFGQIKETHTYAIKDGEELKLDIYYPETFDEKSKFPTIVWMHGGGFSGGSRDFDVDKLFCEEIAKRDFIAVSISYRLTRKGTKEGVGCDCPAETKLETFRKASEDYLDAVSYLVENYSKFKIDTEKLIAGGSSAGAEGILNALFMKKNWFGNKYDNLNFAGFLSFAGAVLPDADLNSEELIPGIFFHGAKDDLVPFDTQSHHLCEMNQPGFFMLKGSNTIVDEYKKQSKPYFLFASKEGKHEHSAIPFDYLEDLFLYINRVMINQKYLAQEIWVH